MIRLPPRSTRMTHSSPTRLSSDLCFSELMARTIGARIALTLDLNAAGLRCRIDRQQFENALLNLAVNARDAMEGRGSLTIRTLRDEEEESAALAEIGRAHV